MKPKPPKLSFLHLQKTGGTGIKAWLKDVPDLDLGHRAKLYDGIPTFTVVREPTARLRSQHAHFKRQNPTLTPGFEDWITRRSTHPICWCLTDYALGMQPRHANDPICRFYASRQALHYTSPLELAKRTLERCQVFRIEEIPTLIQVLAGLLGVDPSTYEPKLVFGTSHSKQDEELVRKHHPLDYELYQWILERRS